MLRQILVVLCVFLVVTFGLAAAGFTMGVPVAIALSCVAVFACLRRDGESLSALGFTRMHPLRAVLLAVGCVVFAYAAAGTGFVIGTRGFGWPPTRFGPIQTIVGDVPKLLGFLALAWTTAAFGEELLFRGFLLGRVRALFGGGTAAGVVAAVVQAIPFGLLHAYQGATGMLVTGLVGLAFGVAYVRLRVLWPLVIAHGTIDTIGLIAVYAGVVPG